jgi:sortase A
MRKTVRLAGMLLLAAGLLTLAWVLVVWRWQDPFTALYTHVQQSHLSHAYERRAAAFRDRLGPSRDLAAVERSLGEEAARYRHSLHRGDPVGRIEIPRIGLNMVVVQGTDHGSLEKGPGHYIPSALPGEGHLVYVAGHRTTYLAPFAHIEAIRVGDPIRLELPYGTFTYRAVRHDVVPSDDLAMLVDRGRDLLRLQACHPRFFATQRYIVDAKLVAVAPRGAPAFTLATRSAGS